MNVAVSLVVDEGASNVLLIGRIIIINALVNFLASCLAVFCAADYFKWSGPLIPACCAELKMRLTVNCGDSDITCYKRSKIRQHRGRRSHRVRVTNEA